MMICDAGSGVEFIRGHGGNWFKMLYNGEKKMSVSYWSSPVSYTLANKWQKTDRKGDGLPILVQKENLISFSGAVCTNEYDPGSPSPFLSTFICLMPTEQHKIC